MSYYILYFNQTNRINLFLNMFVNWEINNEYRLSCYFHYQEFLILFQGREEFLHDRKHETRVKNRGTISRVIAIFFR